MGVEHQSRRQKLESVYEMSIRDNKEISEFTKKLIVVSGFVGVVVLVLLALAHFISVMRVSPVTETTLQMGITALFGTISTLGVGYLALRTKGLELSASAKQDVKQVIQEAVAVQDIRLKAIEKTGEQVHLLTNSGMGAVLMTSLTSAQTLAGITKQPEHEELARKAKSAYDEHMVRQSKADAAASHGPTKVEIVNPNPVPVSVETS